MHAGWPLSQSAAQGWERREMGGMGGENLEVPRGKRLPSAPECRGGGRTNERWMRTQQ